MDADFSHKIQDLVRLNKSKDKNKLIIGSRYVPNGEIVGWDFKRKLLSKYANKFAKFITKSSVNDLTSGFRIYSRNILENIDFSSTKSNGYAFQIEMTLIVATQGFIIEAVPISFEERRFGKSKLDFKSFKKL